MPTEENAHYTYLLPTNVQPIKDYSVNIFAFTATLLGTELISPSLTQIKMGSQFPHFFLTHGRIFMIYMASFLYISNYWIVHYTIFENIIRSNRTLIRLNVLLLLSVTFLPYPSQLISQYGRSAFIAAFYGMTLTFTYLMLTIIMAYAYASNRLTNPEIHLPIRKVVMLKGGVPLGASIIATILAFFFPRLSFLIYFLVSLNLLIPFQRLVKGIEIKEKGE